MTYLSFTDVKGYDPDIDTNGRYVVIGSNGGENYFIFRTDHVKNFDNPYGALVIAKISQGNEYCNCFQVGFVVDDGIAVGVSGFMNDGSFFIGACNNGIGDDDSNIIGQADWAVLVAQSQPPTNLYSFGLLFHGNDNNLADLIDFGEGVSLYSSDVFFGDDELIVLVRVFDGRVCLYDGWFRGERLRISEFEKLGFEVI